MLSFHLWFPSTKHNLASFAVELLIYPDSFKGFSMYSSEEWIQIGYICQTSYFQFVYQLVDCEGAHHMVLMFWN